MGLGSDSLPVHISLHGQDTYLADSMQFALKYFLRLEDGLKGAYYVGASCRGENSDATHLNQFYHVECELLGDFDAGMDVAERYIATLTSALLDKHESLIRAIAGSTSHISDLQSRLKSNGGAFPRITLANALALPEIINNPNTWNYVIESDYRKGRSLRQAGEQILLTHFKGAV